MKKPLKNSTQITKKLVTKIYSDRVIKQWMEDDKIHSKIAKKLAKLFRK